jgi:hypothetical protein
VYGYSSGIESGVGVTGQSNVGIGLHGKTASTSSPAVAAHASGSSTAVYAYSSAGGTPPAAPLKTGVYGYAGQDASARGVRGRSTSGQGVRGEATSGVGVYAIATTGLALRAEGAVRFKTSGLTTIAAGTRSITVDPGQDLTSATKILTTLQGDPGGTTVVQRVAVNTTTNAFTIYLTADTVRAVKVSWFVIS